jgi:hypothetical protein
MSKIRLRQWSKLRAALADTFLLTPEEAEKWAWRIIHEDGAKLADWP